MSDVMYSINEWNKALESADNNSFDSVDSGAEYGPLASWLCEQYTQEKVGQDPDILEAVLNVLENHGYDKFSPELFLTVLGTYRGETNSSFEVLVYEHMEESFGFTARFPGNPGEDDHRGWYIENCCNKEDVFAEVASGSSFHWFCRMGW